MEILSQASVFGVITEHQDVLHSGRAPWLSQDFRAHPKTTSDGVHWLLLGATVGSVVCPEPGQPQGVTDVAPDVVALISHATQERLHGLLVKLTVMAGHRKAAMKVPQQC